mgnify:CR=1 FL=1
MAAKPHDGVYLPGWQAERAANAPAPAPLDQLMKRNAAAILPALRAGNGKAAAAQARKLLPFGKLPE